MLTITKKFEFEYAHLLPRYDGPCSRLHGHRAQLEVEISGPPINVPTAHDMIVDFSDLKELVNKFVVNEMDHNYINDFIRYPTAENMVRWIVSKLQPIFGPNLERIRLYETSNSYAEWRKD